MMRQRATPTPDEFYRWIVQDTARARGFLGSLTSEGRRAFAERCGASWPGGAIPTDLILDSWVGAGHCQAA